MSRYDRGNRSFVAFHVARILERAVQPERADQDRRPEPRR